MAIGFSLYGGNNRYRSSEDLQKEERQQKIDALKDKYGPEYANDIDAYSATLNAVGQADDFETLEETIAEDWLNKRFTDLEADEYNRYQSSLDLQVPKRKIVDNIIRGRRPNESKSIWESVKESLLSDEVKDINYIFDHRSDRKRGDGALSEFSHGLARGYHSTKAIGHGLQAATGSSFDDTRMRDEGIKDYLAEMENARQHEARNTFEDVWEDPSKFIPWLAGVAGEQAPVLASMFVTGGVGGAVGKAVAKKVISKEVGDLIQQGVVNEATKAGLKSMARAQLAGQLFGSAASGTALETGSIYGDIYEKTGEHRPGVALGFGSIAGLVESTPVLFVLRKYGGNLAAKSFIDKMADVVNKGGLPARTIKTGLAESGTEGIQTALERAAVKWVDENQEIFGEEGRHEFINAMAGGFFLGGGMGLGQGAPASRKDENQIGNRVSIQQADGKRVNALTGEVLEESEPVLTPSERISQKKKKVEETPSDEVKLPSERVREKQKQEDQKLSQPVEVKENVSQAPVSETIEHEVVEESPQKKPKSEKEKPRQEDVKAVEQDKKPVEKIESKKQEEIPPVESKQEQGEPSPIAEIMKDISSKETQKEIDGIKEDTLPEIQDVTGDEDFVYDDIENRSIKQVRELAKTVQQEAKQRGIKVDIPKTRKKSDLRDWIVDQWQEQGRIVIDPKLQDFPLDSLRYKAHAEGYSPKGTTREEVIRSMKRERIKIAKELKDPQERLEFIAGRKTFRDLDQKEYSDLVSRLLSHAKASRKNEADIDGTYRFSRERVRKDDSTKSKISTQKIVDEVLSSLKKMKSARDVDIIIHEKAPSWAGQSGKGAAKAAAREGKIHFFTDRNFSKNELAGFLRHEDFVHRWLKAADADTYNKLYRGIEKGAFTQASDLINTVKKMSADYTKKNERGDTVLNERGIEEVIAYYAQDKLGESFIKNMVRKLRDLIKKSFGIDVESLELDGYLREAFSKYVKGVDSSANRFIDGKSSMAVKDEVVHFARERNLKPVDTESQNFKRWFKGSQVVDEDGSPLVLSHGTTHDFSVFDRNKANPEGYVGAGFYFSDSPDDVFHHYAGEGPDLKNRIDGLAERIQQEHEFDGDEMSFEEARELASAELNGGEEKILPVYLRIKKPLVLDPSGGTRFEITYEMDEDGNIIDEEGSGIELYDALDRMSAKYGIENPWGDLMEHFGTLEGQTAYEVFSFLRENDKVLYAENEAGQLVNGEFLREVAEWMEYDGIVMDTDSAGFNMPEVPSGTKHYIAFDPYQIKSAVNNTGEFSETNPDIYFARERSKKSKLDLIPGWKGIRKYLTDEETKTENKGTVKSIVEVFKELPQDIEFMEAAKAGKIKKGWYQRASESLESIFGDDNELFVSLLAATSPRQTVEQNMLMSLEIYNKWLQAGRPDAGHTDPSMKDSYFNAWSGLGQGMELSEEQKNTPHPIMKILALTPGASMRSRALNVIRALQGRPLHGDKVNSFKQNLLGDLEPSTNDTWMAQFGNISQDIFGTKTGYKAFTAKIRRVAKKLDWKPAEVQETIWSFYKTLYEAQKGGVLGRGALEKTTPERIGKTPEFATMILKDEQIRNKLKQLGVGEQVFRNLESIGEPNENAQSSGAEKSDQRILGRIAKRAEKQRKAELKQKAESLQQSKLTPEINQNTFFALDRKEESDDDLDNKSEEKLLPDEKLDTQPLDFDMIRDENLGSKAGYYARRIQARLQDRLNWIPILHEKIKAAGGTVTDEMDAHLQEELSHSKIGVRMDDFRQDWEDPILKMIDEKKINIADLDLYLYARHAEERNEQIKKRFPSVYKGSGMTTTKAKKILKEYDEKNLTKDLSQIEVLVRDMNEDYMDMIVKDGLESQETVDRWRSAYKYYVPLLGKSDPEENMTPFKKEQNRLLGLTEEKQKYRLSGGLDVRGRESKVAEGRKDVAREPILANLMAKYQAAIVRAERAKAGNAIIDLAIANPNKKFWEVGSLEFHTEFNPETGEFNKVATDPKEEEALNVMLDEPWQSVVTKSDKVFVSKRGGKLIFLKVHGNKDLVRQLKNLNKPIEHKGLEKAVQVMSSVVRGLSMLNTSLNPEFVLTNLERDLTAATINMTGEKSKGLAAKSIKDLAPAMKGIWKAEFSKTKGDSSRAKKSWVDWYRHFKENGGDTAFLSNVGVEEVVKNINLQLNKGKFRTAVDGIFDVIEKMNKGVEAGIRLSAYKNMIESGMKPTNAASYAKNLTVNFNRKGEWSSFINALYMFFNASVQSNVRLYQAISNNKVKWIMGGAMLGGILNSVLNRIYGGDDEDGESYYDKIPMGIKNSNFIVMNPFGDKSGDYFKIRLPYGYNVPYAVGNVLTHTLSGKMGVLESSSHVMSAFMESFNPLGTASGSFKNVLEQTVAPTLLDPVVQIKNNENFFGGKIRPEQRSFDGTIKPYAELYFKNVNPILKAIGSTVAAIGGGDEVRAGYLDAISNPENLEHLIINYTGGTGKFITNTSSTVYDLLKGREWKPNKTPFVRQFYGEKNIYGDRDKYTRYRNDVLVAVKKHKTYLDLKDKSSAQKILKKYKKEISLHKHLKTTDKKLKKLRSKRYRVMRKIRAEEDAQNRRMILVGLRAELKEIEKHMHQERILFNAKYKKVVEEK